MCTKGVVPPPPPKKKKKKKRKKKQAGQRELFISDFFPLLLALKIKASHLQCYA
jgi:hypothetical protein